MSPFSMGAALRFGARHLLRNLPVFVAIEAAYVALWVVLELLVFRFASTPGSWWWVALHLAWLFATSVPEAALLRVALSVRESGSWTRSDLEAAVRLAPIFFVAKVIYLLAILLGVLLLIVTGVYAAVRHAPWGFVVTAGERRPFAAISTSAEMTDGVKWKLLGFGALLLLINAFGAALLGVGLVFTLPLTAMAAADVFQRLRDRHGCGELVPRPGP